MQACLLSSFKIWNVILKELLVIIFSISAVDIKELETI